MNKKEQIAGFPVLLRNGKEVSASDALLRGAQRSFNGPHQDAKWARQLLGTDYTASQRRNLRRGFPVGRSFSPPSHIPPHRDWSAETGRGPGFKSQQ